MFSFNLQTIIHFMEASETMLRNAYQKSEYLARIEMYKQDQMNLYNLYVV